MTGLLHTSVDTDGYDRRLQRARVIIADPFAWYRLVEAAMGARNHRDAAAAIADPRTVWAMLKDYRAGLTVDRELDAADRAAGRRVSAPVLVM